MTKRKSKHIGYWVDIDGEPVHMLADPNMSPESKAALEAVVRAVRKRMDDKYSDEGDGLHLCEVCQDYECQWPETKCWRCREQEWIDKHG